MSLVAPLGRLTFTPSRSALCACSTMKLADTMKMMRRTRKTSVSGVMLISAKMPPSFSSSGIRPSAIAGLLLVAHQRLEELLDEELELDGVAREALVEVVVDDHCLDGDGDTERRGDEGVGDAGGDDGQAAAGLVTEGVEGAHDADDGAEEAQERRDDGDGAEDPQAGLHVEVHAQARAIDRRLDDGVGAA